MTGALKNEEICIGFLMETSFHYEVYRNIIANLIKRKIRCELVIHDLIEHEFVNEMLTFLSTLSISGLDCTLFSTALRLEKQYTCMISPYYIKSFDVISKFKIRAIYGLAKNNWNHAQWNKEYDAILCYSEYTKNELALGDKVHAVGNPKFDNWHNEDYSVAIPTGLKFDPKKPTILYAPTYGELSSLIPWSEKIGRLSHEYNVITKLHHGTLYKRNELESLKKAKRHLKNIIYDNSLIFPLLHLADFVISDNSGFIFDAINADKRVILLNWEGMESLLINERTFSSNDSPEQLVRKFLPVVHDMVDLRRYLSNDYDWLQHAENMQYIKTTYCDAFNDGMAGERAAEVIINTITA